MLTTDQIRDNRITFESLLRSITRPGADIEGLINKLEREDFFYAPASTQFHCAYEGGLCEHSLHVYEQLKKLVEMEGINIPEESIIITALLHDISKMGFYTTYVANRKVYSPEGKRRDEQGTFDWVAEKAWKVKDAKERFLYGTHGQNSEFMTGVFIPLQLEESVAIINHMGITEKGETNYDLTSIFNKYPLASLLHSADMLATFIMEREV